MGCGPDRPWDPGVVEVLVPKRVLFCSCEWEGLVPENAPKMLWDPGVVGVQFPKRGPFCEWEAFSSCDWEGVTR